jgi:hypothetical protein
VLMRCDPYGGAYCDDRTNRLYPCCRVAHGPYLQRTSMFLLITVPPITSYWLALTTAPRSPPPKTVVYHCNSSPFEIRVRARIRFYVRESEFGL